MKTAAAYVRVSTDDQLEYSPDSQIKLILDYAKRNDLILPGDFIFQDDGISGKNAKKRPNFNKMIALAKSEEHPIDVILVWKFSRFARNQEESIVYKNLLRKKGVEVRSISEPTSDDAFGSLIERIIEWMDEYYLINLSTEVKRGMTEKVSRGEPVNAPPVGYDMVDGKYVPSSDAPYIRDIFKSFNSGEGMRHIAIRLTNEGMRTKRGGVIDNRFIDYVLHNPVYIGKIRWSKDGKAASTRHYDDENIIVVDGQHEPLISMEEWNAAQARIADLKQRYPKNQRPEQSVDYMLKGIVKCSSCGSTLCRTVTDPPSLQCHSYSKGSCHVSHSILMKKAENTIIKAIEDASGSMSFNIAPASPSVKSNSVQKQIDAEKRKLERVKAAYTSGIDTIEEYRQNKTKILEAIARLEKQNEAKPFDLKDYAKKVEEVLLILKGNYPPDVQNEALRSIVSEIEFSRATGSFKIFFHV